jgi:hypothetical protein
MAVKRIQYRCKYCGRRETRFVSDGKPQPGQCPTRNGTNLKGTKPHVWEAVQKYET